MKDPRCLRGPSRDKHYKPKTKRLSCPFNNYNAGTDVVVGYHLYYWYATAITASPSVIASSWAPFFTRQLNLILNSFVGWPFSLFR